MKIFTILLLLFLFSPALLFADTIILKNGKQYSGKIVGQSRTNIRIKTEQGVKTIAKSTIKSVKFGTDQTGPSEAQKLAKIKREQELAKKEQERKEAEIARQKAEQEKLDQKQRNKAAEDKRIAEEKSRNTNTKESPTRLGALWRSMVYPGWGQFYSDRDTSGYVYSGFGTAILGYFIYADNNLKLAQDDYTNIATGSSTRSLQGIVLNMAGYLDTTGMIAFYYFIYSEPRKEVLSATKTRTTAFNALALFWLVNVADSWLLFESPVSIQLIPDSITYETISNSTINLENQKISNQRLEMRYSISF